MFIDSKLFFILIKIYFLSFVVFKMVWYFIFNNIVNFVYEGIIVSVDWKSVINGGRKFRVKKKF